MHCSLEELICSACAAFDLRHKMNINLESVGRFFKRTKMKSLFNIYYINFAKVYEIKMMLGNEISTMKNIEHGQSSSIGGRVDGSLRFNLFAHGGGAEGEIKGERGGSQKVIETFEVKTTKSIILKEILDGARKIDGFGKVHEGELVVIDNVRLQLQNEAELRIAKFISDGSLKGFVAPNTNGLDLNNVFNSLLKDYAYKLKGSIGKAKDQLIIKIPFTFENEFESGYNVDDMTIGNVSIVGIYKGQIHPKSLKTNMEYWSELGVYMNQNQNVDYKDFHYSSFPSDEIFEKQDSFYNEDADSLYHYVDLLAIIQNVQIREQ